MDGFEQQLDAGLALGTHVLQEGIAQSAGGTRTLFVPTEEKVSVSGHPFQFSLLASAGIEFSLVDRLSLYAEPGAAWHVVTPKSLPGYYRDHPVSFDFRFGLRFDL